MKRTATGCFMAILCLAVGVLASACNNSPTDPPGDFADRVSTNDFPCISPTMFLAAVRPDCTSYKIHYDTTRTPHLSNSRRLAVVSPADSSFTCTPVWAIECHFPEDGVVILMNPLTFALPDNADINEAINVVESNGHRVGDMDTVFTKRICIDVLNDSTSHGEPLTDQFPLPEVFQVYGQRADLFRRFEYAFDAIGKLIPDNDVSR